MPRKRPTPTPSAPPLGAMVPVSDLARADISRGLEKILGQLATPALLEGVIARASYYLTCRALHTTHRQDLPAQYAAIKRLHKALASTLARWRTLDMDTRATMMSAMAFVSSAKDDETFLPWCCRLEAGMVEFVRSLDVVCKDFPYDSLGERTPGLAFDYYLQELVRVYAHYVKAEMRITHNPYQRPRSRRTSYTLFWQFIQVCVAPFEPDLCKEAAFVRRVERQRDAVILTHQVHTSGNILLNEPAGENGYALKNK